jgi:hypothetical protein
LEKKVCVSLIDGEHIERIDRFHLAKSIVEDYTWIRKSIGVEGDSRHLPVFLQMVKKERNPPTLSILTQLGWTMKDL